MRRKLLALLCSVALLGLVAIRLQPVRAIGTCDEISNGPYLVTTFGSQPRDVIIDPDCSYAYATNPVLNQVEVLDLRTGGLVAPIPVGAGPTGLDITPDGSALYVANREGRSISVVDLLQRIEVRRIPVPTPFQKPSSVAIANNGKALVTTTAGGSGNGGVVLQLVLSTDALSVRTDFGTFGAGISDTSDLEASGDRTTIAIVQSNSSAGPVALYHASTDSFGQRTSLNDFLSFMNPNRTGTRFTVGRWLLDESLHQIGTLPGGGYGAAFSPDGSVIYAVGYLLDIIDVASMTRTASIALPDTMGNNSFGLRLGTVAISGDGSTLAIITDHGITIAPAAVPTGTPTATPTPHLTAYLDCQLSSLEIQSDCDIPLAQTHLEIGVYLRNDGVLPVHLGSFNFEILNNEFELLGAITEDATVACDSNPDFDDGAIPGSWFCSPPDPMADDEGSGLFGRDIDDSSTQHSLLSAFNGEGDGPVLQPGSTIRLAVIDYGVKNPPSGSVASLSLENFQVSDDEGEELGSCAPVIEQVGECEQAALHFLSLPTFTPSPTPTIAVSPTTTPTPIPPTITSTPTPEGPRVEKQPEGNAANADLSVPKANLWVCETGPCAGPGEGALRVVEHAFGVQDGLGAYEFTVEYDNFVIQSVNPCDLVFGPGGAGSGRGPVDELDASAVNTDCAPDPGAGGGTCAYSLVLENLVHFGCVTLGQAPGPVGDFDLASLLLVPHPDLNNDLFPGNDNGVLTVIKDNGCELVDTLGHAVTGSINGGLTPFCRDLAVTVRILEGDLDLDCDVDLTDAQLIATKYGAFFGGLLYSKWYDLEPALHDLDIDIKDVQKVFGRQGSTCQAPIPAQPPLDPPAPFGD